jgi:hypothetical protein
MNNFCTTATVNYLPYVLTLNDSIKNNGYSKLYVLIVDSDNLPDPQDGIIYLTITEVQNLDLIHGYLEKGEIDEFRWSLKPYLMNHLIQKYDISELIYVDNDIMFYGDYQFLFDELKNFNVLLTPHWRSPYPKVDSRNFYLLYNHGIFNAGFIGVNSKAVDFLKWFCEVVSYTMKRNEGFYVDQKFLDVVPIYFDSVKVLKHKGCNVSEWSESFLLRDIIDNKLYINGDPLIFFHFVRYYDKVLYKRDRDPLVKSFYSKWKDSLIKNGLIINQPSKSSTNIRNRSISFIKKVVFWK